MLKRILACLLAALLFTCPAMAESADPQAEIDALNARILELEATVADLEARLAQYEPKHDPSEPIITFNGGSIPLSEAQKTYDETIALYEQFGMDPAEYADEVKTDVLDNLAGKAILAIKAQGLGVYENTPEQQAAAEEEARIGYDATLSYYLPYFEEDGLSEADVRAAAEAYLSEEGITYEIILEEIIAEQWQDRLYQHVTADITIDEADVRAQYDTALASAKEMYADPEMFEYDYSSGEIVLYRPEGYREVQYLLLPYAEDDDAADLAAKGENVCTLYADLISRAAAGEDLTVLAEEAMLYDYGVMAVCADSTLISAAFTETAMALQLNETAAPLVDEAGVWLMRYTGDVEAGEIPYETVQADLTETALENARIDAYGTQMDQWIAEADLVIRPEMLQ